MTDAIAREHSDRPRATDPFILAVLFGALAGAIHVAVVLVRRHWLHIFTWSSRDVIWMSPLGNVLLLLAPALVLAIGIVLRVRWVGWRLTGTLLAFGALVSVGLLIRGLHWGAVLVVALGASTQLGAKLAVLGSRWRPRFVRVSAALVGSFALLGAASRIAQSSPGTNAFRTNEPNVLLIVLDAVRTKSIGVYGATRPVTPALDSLAGEGVVFERAFATAPWTLPSHTGMFTGRAASELSASWRHPFDGAVPTVAEAFRREGYATGAFVGNTFYTHHESGLGRGFELLRDFDVSFSQVLRSTTVIQTPTGLGLLNARSLLDVRKAIRYFDLTERSEPENDRRLASEVMAQFRSWQLSLGRRPFFAFVNLYDAHDPYAPPAPWDQRFGTTKEDRYDGGVAYMDAVLDSTFKSLAGQGLLDNTIVVVTADHGEQFGEHGLHNHGNSLYLPLIHVPLFIRYPARVPGGKRVHRVVSQRDLPATLFDLAGVRGAGEVSGTSLLAEGDADSTGGEALSETEKTDGGGRDHPAAHGDMGSLLNDSLHLILNGDGRAELYAYVRDPAETTDLAGRGAWCDVLRGMTERLRQQSGYARKAPKREPCGAAAGERPSR